MIVHRCQNCFNHINIAVLTKRSGKCIGHYCRKILSQEGAITRLSEFVNRTKEIGDIEESVRTGYKLIILQGILGIGKSSLAEKAIAWLYPNKAMSRIIIDFNMIPGIAELAIEMSSKTRKKLINQNSTIDDQQKYKIFY